MCSSDRDKNVIREYCQEAKVYRTLTPMQIHSCLITIFVVDTWFTIKCVRLIVYHNSTLQSYGESKVTSGVLGQQRKVVVFLNPRANKQ